MTPNIDAVLQLARLCNVSHFPQGIVVERHNGGFRAGFLTKENPYFPHSSANKSADGALDDLVNHVHNAAKKMAQQKHNEAVQINSEVQALLAAAKEGA